MFTYFNECYEDLTDDITSVWSLIMSLYKMVCSSERVVLIFHPMIILVMRWESKGHHHVISGTQGV